jgi:hypothetical protein
MAKRDAKFLQILISQKVQDGDIDVIFDKPVRVLGKPEPGQPLCN